MDVNLLSRSCISTQGSLISRKRKIKISKSYYKTHHQDIRKRFSQMLKIKGLEILNQRVYKKIKHLLIEKIKNGTIHLLNTTILQNHINMSRKTWRDYPWVMLIGPNNILLEIKILGLESPNRLIEPHNFLLEVSVLGLESPDRIKYGLFLQTILSKLI